MSAADRRLTPVQFEASAVSFGARGQDGTRSFRGIAYGGGIITDHPHFDRVAFDLGSTRLDTPAPVLLDHREPVGVIEAATIGRTIEIAGRLFADVEGASKRVAEFADRGMPWQMSVGIWPGRIEDVHASASVAINGQHFAGPLSVLRDNRVREVSFVALGADAKTSAEVFSIGRIERPAPRIPRAACAIHAVYAQAVEIADEAERLIVAFRKANPDAADLGVAEAVCAVRDGRDPRAVGAHPAIARIVAAAARIVAADQQLGIATGPAAAVWRVMHG